MNIVLGGSFHDASSLVQSAGNTQKGTNGPPTLPTHEHISIYVFFLSLQCALLLTLDHMQLH